MAQEFLWAGRPSCHSTDSIQLLKRKQSTDSTNGQASSFRRPPLDSWRNGHCLLPLEHSLVVLVVALLL